MATSSVVVQRARHRGFDRRSGARRQASGVLSSPFRQVARDQRADLTTRAVTERKWWRVLVVRDDRIIDWRIAPTELAEAYAKVLGLLYPADKIRAREISAHEAAYSRDRPYDPRD